MFTTLADGDLPKVAHVQHSDRKVNNATLEQQAAEETKELSLSSSVYNVKPVSKGEIAFVFDIDGVFVRGSRPIPGGFETLTFLQDNNIPFIFLTNGGGKTEADHVALLSKRLHNIPLHEDQFVQSHTPFRDLLPEYKNKNILVLGGTKNTVRDVAHAYGFEKVLISSDLVKLEGEHVHPFLELTKDHHGEHGRHPHLHEEKDVEISAIMCFTSPRDVGLDLTLILDLLLSDNGKIGTLCSKNGNPQLPNNGYLQSNQPRVYFCNPDLTWATSYKHPRVAQGMFKSYLEGGWGALTNHADLSTHLQIFGKPTRETYLYAEKMLLAWHRKLAVEEERQVRRVYMVGDNPMSDIRGANEFVSPCGVEWKSILVCSGVHEGGKQPPITPSVIVKDVQAAVEWALGDVDAGFGDGA